MAEVKAIATMMKVKVVSVAQCMEISIATMTDPIMRLMMTSIEAVAEERICE